ncbi:MAG: hypothetical protein GY809_14520, partial [Planctomycetes bacterium]|nr:hypothetical protein [Planctomycetota bacterium]
MTSKVIYHEGRLVYSNAFDSDPKDPFLTGMGILTFLLILPLFGAALIAALPSGSNRLIRVVALGTATLNLILACGLLFSFDTSQPGLQFVEVHRWNPRLGTTFSLGVDGFSLPMVLLATLLSLVAIMASSSIDRQVKAYYFLMLLLEAAMTGVFMALDWALFYVFWELTLIPLFFLID